MKDSGDNDDGRDGSGNTGTGIVTKTRPKTKKPSLYKVLLLNDDYTTQDFVVWVLETIFHKPRGEAFAIMLSVHQSGLGVAGVYTRDIAETKLRATERLAEQHEFPLLVTMEPEGDREGHT